MNVNLIQELARASGYNESAKKKFKETALRFLRETADKCGIPHQCIMYNPGGIAVAGDAVLHSDKWYVHLGEFCYYREVEGVTDYTGGHNRRLTTQSAAELAALLK